MRRSCFQSWGPARSPRACSHAYFSVVHQLRYASKSVVAAAKYRRLGVSKLGRDVYRKSDEVEHALLNNQPVVALESTIYTHGFPYPDNVSLALELESIVRSNGGIPATIGILDGVARVGLSREELIALASSAGKPDTMKVSRRDLPYILGMVSRYFSSLRSACLLFPENLPLAHPLVPLHL